MHTTHFTDSSNVKSASWEDETLYLTFVKTGAVYRYDGVPFETYTSLVNAASVGQFFHSSIKNQFVCNPVPQAHALALGVTA